MTQNRSETMQSPNMALPTSASQSATVTVIAPTRGLASLQLRAVWQYRELLYFLVWRDIKVRYKQTALGVAWIVLQPLLSTVVFTLLFGGLLKVPSGGAPYPALCPRRAAALAVLRRQPEPRAARAWSTAPT